MERATFVNIKNRVNPLHPYRNRFSRNRYRASNAGGRELLPLHVKENIIINTKSGVLDSGNFTLCIQLCLSGINKYRQNE